MTWGFEDILMWAGPMFSRLTVSGVVLSMSFLIGYPKLCLSLLARVVLYWVRVGESSYSSGSWAGERSGEVSSLISVRLVRGSSSRGVDNFCSSSYCILLCCVS